MTLNNFIQIQKKQHTTGLRVDCYYGILEKMKAQNPKAHFEIIMRFPFDKMLSESVLSPSKNLLAQVKANKISFREFTISFEKEIFRSKDAISRMQLLKELANHQEVFLVCCEKDPSHCHRSLVKYYIEHLPELRKKWRI